MEHIIVTKRADGNYLLKAEEGYKLFNINTQQTYSEAIVSEGNLTMWKACECHD